MWKWRIFNLFKQSSKSVEGIELEESLQKYFKENDLVVWPSIEKLPRGKIKNYDLI